jgi:hypothetical protein
MGGGLIHAGTMQQSHAAKKRALIWQITGERECYACAGCSWTYPNPNKLTEQEHDASQVQRRFNEHICNRRTSA